MQLQQVLGPLRNTTDPLWSNLPCKQIALPFLVGPDHGGQLNNGSSMGHDWAMLGGYPSSIQLDLSSGKARRSQSTPEKIEAFAGDNKAPESFWRVFKYFFFDRASSFQRLSWNQCHNPSIVAWWLKVDVHSIGLISMSLRSFTSLSCHFCLFLPQPIKKPKQTPMQTVCSAPAPHMRSVSLWASKLSWKGHLVGEADFAVLYIWEDTGFTVVFL